MAIVIVTARQHRTTRRSCQTHKEFLHTTVASCEKNQTRVGKRRSGHLGPSLPETIGKPGPAVARRVVHVDVGCITSSCP